MFLKIVKDQEAGRYPGSRRFGADRLYRDYAKRCSARSALNELSKYITLLVKRDRLPPEMVRCVVLSTHWKELWLPLFFFAQSVGVDVSALEAKRDGDRVPLEPVELFDMSVVKQLSPDTDLIWFDTEEPVEFMRERATSLPFVRLAVLTSNGVLKQTSPSCPMRCCRSRIPALL
jgi:hypothetical protein